TELELLIAGLVATPHCLGVEITVFDPDYDPTGAYAAEIVETLVAGLAPAATVAPLDWAALSVGSVGGSVGGSDPVVSGDAAAEPRPAGTPTGVEEVAPAPAAADQPATDGVAADDVAADQPALDRPAAEQPADGRGGG